MPPAFRYGVAMEDNPQYLLSKSYAPAVQGRLSRLPSRDQLSIASWLIRTPIGTHYALQVIECLENLARQEESHPAKILSQVLTDFSGAESLPKETGRQVRDILINKLHPQNRGPTLR